MTETQEHYKRKAQEAKAGKIVTQVHLLCVEAVRLSAPVTTADERKERAARVAAMLRLLKGGHGGYAAVETREVLLDKAGLADKGASPETWAIVHARLAEDYANLALDLPDDPFEGLP